MTGPVVASAAKPTPSRGSGKTESDPGKPSGAIEPDTATSVLSGAAGGARDYGLWLVIPDTHIPEHDRQAVDAVEQYAADERWDGWVHLGDLGDNEAISDYSRDYPRKRSNAPRVTDSEFAVNEFLDRHLAIVSANNPDVEKIIIEGNHEFRTERYVDRAPELEGKVDIEKDWRLKERGVKYVRYWSKGDLYRIGKLYLGHGVYTVQNHANKHVREYGCNLLYGHCHDVQSSYIRRRGSNHPLMAQSVGCLCKYDQLYMRGRPMNWMHAFAVVAAFPDGTFQHTVVPIINGRFVGPTNGKVYKGSK